MTALDALRACAGFQWDEGSLSKNWDEHRVSDAECEDGLFTRPLLAAIDREHSAVEGRFFALGTTDVE